MAPVEECRKEIVVLIQWEEDKLAVPLAQLEVENGDEETWQAVGDWHYWVAMGYQF